MIDFSYYVSITSGVGGGVGVKTRDLILRIFSSSNQIPVGSIVEFEKSELDGISDYFGADSEEYKRAVWYFGFVSKSITSPQKISFARWVKSDQGAYILGATIPNDSLSLINTVTAGGFEMILGGETATVTDLDLSSAATFADVAIAIQTKIQTSSGAFAAVTVTYNAVNTRFEFTSTEQGELSITDGAQTPLALIGWANPQARISNGSASVEPVVSFDDSTNVNNNFFSVDYIDILTLDQYVALATSIQTSNVMFELQVPLLAANAVAWSEALNFGGTALTLYVPANNDYPWLVPAVVSAATNYNKRNAAKNYMFQSASGLVPTVTSTATAKIYDGMRINYYGITQNGGQMFEMYQRGLLMGSGTSITDMGVYTNEAWLKSYVGSQIMSLFLNLETLPANEEGKALILNMFIDSEQGVIAKAKFNGTIIVGKTLNLTQKTYITQLTGDDKAWLKVQQDGYWLDAVVEEVTVQNGATEYKAVYTLIYSKADSIRKVEGTHVLI